ncbi:5'/3'-nucleotidase SurE [Halorientalis regularis]|uniref:5'-nucleotidase n=1 Tax=Halorientalis regularis TaxID=660518 RepID=A0A1G7KA27_9EURY|nr:5'/3'-nucleotidase SurE [Halorientalis regularis]SDF34093.1 5'-nucleotidase [Halorientalis regularis]
MTAPHVLLTNDDGIDAPGLAALYEELTGVAEVTVVAPTDNQSGTGRTRTHRTTREEHPWGYAIDGTPADCVAYGIGGLDADFDLVVAGCNHGPNAGNYVVGRSGTVGACIEAAFLDVPGIAISAYHAQDFFVHPPEEYDFGRPAKVARELLVRSQSSPVFEDADVLNVNAPVDVPESAMRLTEPHHDYAVDVEHEAAERDEVDIGKPRDGDIAIRDVVWPNTVGWESPFPADEDLRERYPVGSDRRALVEGEVSVSPLTAPALSVETGSLQQVVDGYNDSERARERAHEEQRRDDGA